MGGSKEATLSLQLGPTYKECVLGATKILLQPLVGARRQIVHINCSTINANCTNWTEFDNNFMLFLIYFAKIFGFIWQRAVRPGFVRENLISPIVL